MMASGSKYKEPRVNHYRTETQQLIQMMMQESRLTDFQQRQINNQLKNGGALPLAFDPTPLVPSVQSEPRVTRVTALIGQQQRRSAERCRAGDNYKREQFKPKPIRDLEKEKRQLQNLFSTGQKDVGPTHSQRDSTERKEQQIDRFQEVLDDIEERRQFLEDMMAVGKGHQYQHLINTEISQKIHELEKIDRKRSEELSTLKLDGKKEQSKERDREGENMSC
ncbi:UPF0193 protein EVG1 [Sinocyclocheilus rhinocerous]|nr:PREDICTED: UPF0193 protein EVG1-like [Sinocyclocheilus rhinocerous]XP_016378992.1 PREDICTED: UPF0193 protein EVG1-like [Sinocyclocheilus rhinocerous]XP_016378993.1 PREDICTED: UPF0193 protein EVG1-like [Sinocyclocheilus rhinocerous]XP_016378994.1 PREDICTED: UPF0193 protein EVG1-like [Sinocyclocheilus rhinocerous]